jgi:Domain of unknown function (DUF1127).
MTTQIAQTPVQIPAPASGRIAAIACHPVTRLAQLQAAYAEQRRLHGLDPVQLKDIGLTRTDLLAQRCADCDRG